MQYRAVSKIKLIFVSSIIKENLVMGRFPVPDKVLFVCTGSKCSKRGGKDMFKTAKRFAKYSGQAIEVIRIECTDRCDWAPVCTLSPGNIWLKEYSEKDVLKLLSE